MAKNRPGLNHHTNKKSYYKKINKRSRDNLYDINDHIESRSDHSSTGATNPMRGGQVPRSPPITSDAEELLSRYENVPSTLLNQPESIPDGIHPSRLALFAHLGPGKKSRQPSLSSEMAPGPEQRNYPARQQAHQHQNQPRQHPNGSNINGEQQNQVSRQQQQPQQQRQRDQERDRSQQRSTNGAAAAVPPPTPMGSGPMPNHIQVAKPYVFQQAIEGCLKDVGVAQAREDNLRLAGVQWIDNVRRALKLPVRTFDSAVLYYHKFRLVHSDGEYSFVDAAAASLFAACKTEDTLKKSRDILCAAHNLKITNRAEHLSPDDSSFEHHSRTIIGLERLMLESSSFDFRNRHPQHLLIKLAKFYGLPKSSPITKTAYTICLDLYRTFAPLKQCTATLAFACLELSGRLLGEVDNYPGLQDIVNGRDYDRWNISRAEVMETLLDLLELYTHYRTSTTIGPEFNLDTFLEVRIPLNDELNAKNLPRFTEYIASEKIDRRAEIGSYAATVNGVPAAIAAVNGANKTDTSPTSPGTTPGSRQNGVRQKAGERGRDGTVRFMLNPDREQQERAVVAEYGIPGTGPVTGPATGSGPSHHHHTINENRPKR